MQATKPRASLPHLERIVASSVAVWVIVLVSYLILANRTIDNTQVYFLKILLSLSVGIVVATLPGFIQLKYDALGLGIRAAGGAAAFVFVYATSPSMPALHMNEDQPKSEPRPLLKLVDVKTIDTVEEIDEFYRTWVDRPPWTTELPRAVFAVFPIMDVKLANYGGAIAFVKRLDIKILKTSMREDGKVEGGAILRLCAPVLVSFFYNVDFSNSGSETISMDLSQAVRPSEADRFAIIIGQSKPESPETTYSFEATLRYNEAESLFLGQFKVTLPDTYCFRGTEQRPGTAPLKQRVE